MALAAGDILRVSARFKNDVTGDVMNVFHFRMDAATVDDDANVMTKTEIWLDTTYSTLDSMSDELIPFDFKVDVVEKVGGVISTVRNIGQETWVLTSPPAGSADPLPQGCAAVVNFKTSDPRVQGRKYFGTWTDSAAGGDTWAGAILTDLVLAGANALAGLILTGGTGVPGTISTVLGGATGDGFFGFVSALANSIVAYQRRRKRGVGS